MHERYDKSVDKFQMTEDGHTSKGGVVKTINE